MPSVAVNQPKTPVTKGSNGMATATLPNMCKMPPPPPPFLPTPLPNIGMSGKQPQKYSTSVKIEGQPVAIQGSTFGSVGDIASKGTGGGVVSNNAEGPTAFLAPGSLDVKIEGKDVQFLGDQMLNNCGPAGSPANSATMGGVLQVPAGVVLTADEQAVGDCLCSSFCEKVKKGFKKGPRGGWSKKKSYSRRHNWSYVLEREMEGSAGAPAPACLSGHNVKFTEHFENPKTIPDATMRDASGAVCCCFDFKFPGDRFRGNQRQRQAAIAGKPPLEVSTDTCGC